MLVDHSILVSLVLLFAECGACAQQPASSADPLADPPPTAEAIMARVASNQDQAEAQRSRYIYIQHARVSSLKGTTLICEEITDSRVAPSASGSDQQLLKLDGKVLRKRKYVTYTTPLSKNEGKNPIETGPGSLSIEIGDDDRDLVQIMRSNLTNDKSRDGIAARLFPLTSKSQSDYLFHLIGRERVNGRDVFHIGFHPKEKGDFGWKGDAYIDAIAYQPVIVSTAMARKLPFAVRTLLGTSLPGLGFHVVYAPLSEGVWFPVSFGTEFQVHVLFFFNRQIVINAKNYDFEKTHVDSKIIGAVDAAYDLR